MPTTTRSAARKKQKTAMRNAVVLSEDLLMVILAFIDFATLIRVQRVCMHRKLIVFRSIPSRLGNKPFEAREELCRRIRQCYGDDKVK
mmetsp:Transcript_28821/g.42541  ORF Transcript_28821/g.42541 Transcript_28821/m.42541 type:complete len:88 (+) Transcript_28821:282-545(+)